MGSDTVLLSVIIPYYQRSGGILRKAVLSELRQDGFSDFDIVVDDDGSPVPAMGEIGDLVAAHPGRIKVVERPNGGAGAARNTALVTLPPGRRYAAFLDSDDEWEPHHLASAVAVLERGYDFYFANLYHLDQDVSKFDNEERTQFPTRLRPEEMAALDGLAQCYAFRGDMFDRVLFSGNLLMPSAVVYRFDRFAGIRFHVEFRHCGEEYLFFAELAQAGASFAFSWRPGVRCGHGVNIYEKSGWGTPGFLERLCDEFEYRKFAAATWALSERQSAQSKRILEDIRKNFTIAFLGHLKNREFAPLRHLVRFMKRDPAYLLRTPYLLAKAL